MDDLKPSASFDFVIAGAPVSVFLLVDGTDVFTALKGFDSWHPYDENDLADIAQMFAKVSSKAAQLKADLLTSSR
jgi:hypothetical protein